MENSLHHQSSESEIAQLLEPFHNLANDREFWNHTSDGLAVFGSAGFFRVYHLQRTVSPFVVVADSFHTKALRRILQSVDRYHVLALSLDHIRLFEGNRDSLDEISPAPGVPLTLTEALGEELTEPHQTVASYGGSGGTSTPMHHGHGGRKEETEIDAQRFFRAIDKAINTHHSQASGMPLILAALPEHHGLFRQLSHNPALLAEGIKGDPNSMSPSQLRESAWQIMEPEHQARYIQLAESFAKSKARGSGLEDLTEIAEAAQQGRVATLLIEADRQIAGRLHPGSGNVHFDDAPQVHGDDLLDDLGELVIQQGGRVFVLPSVHMPSDTGAAASSRY
nr:hypothetical protein [Phragmitibacter flavus]